MKSFAKYAWGVLLYNIVVVVWGAYVRASKAGAGCGEHWPDCNGAIIPLAGSVKTFVEFTHRATSGLAGFAVLGLLIWAFRSFPKRHAVRTGAVLAFIFIVFEAAIGAVLVKKGLVAENDSIARAFVISLHLVNTLLLLAFLALTAWWATTRAAIGWPLQVRENFKTALLLGACLLSVIFLSASGAITALGATLFPVTSINEGLARDLSPTHFLQSLIWIHPVAAVLIGLAITFVVVLFGLSNQQRSSATLSKIQVGLLITQLLLGGINLLLHAPVWMQLIHLFVANLVWLNLVLFTAALLTRQTEPRISVPENSASTVFTNIITSQE